MFSHLKDEHWNSKPTTNASIAPPQPSTNNNKRTSSCAPVDELDSEKMTYKKRKVSDEPTIAKIALRSNASPVPLLSLPPLDLTMNDINPGLAVLPRPGAELSEPLVASGVNVTSAVEPPPDSAVRESAIMDWLAEKRKSDEEYLQQLVKLSKKLTGNASCVSGLPLAQRERIESTHSQLMKEMASASDVLRHSIDVAQRGFGSFIVWHD